MVLFVLWGVDDAHVVFHVLRLCGFCSFIKIDVLPSIDCLLSPINFIDFVYGRVREAMPYIRIGSHQNIEPLINKFLFVSLDICGYVPPFWIRCCDNELLPHRTRSKVISTYSKIRDSYDKFFSLLSDLALKIKEAYSSFKNQAFAFVCQYGKYMVAAVAIGGLLYFGSTALFGGAALGSAAVATSFEEKSSPVKETSNGIYFNLLVLQVDWFMTNLKPPLSSSAKRVSEYDLTPLEAGIAKDGIPPLPFPTELLNESTRALKEKILAVCTPVVLDRQSLLTNKEIYEGIPGLIKSIELNSSEGLPLQLLRSIIIYEF